MHRNEIPDERPSTTVLHRQREANQALVLAGIRAHEATDRAVESQRNAEATTERLRKTQEELEATAQFRERLLGIIGHDLRNPLQTTLMAARFQIARGSLSAEDARLARLVVQSSERMARMLDHLVAFTRARLGGGFDLKLQPDDLGDICFRTAEELRVTSKETIVQTADGDLAGVWDADRLAQVFSNLAGNAVDHARPGTPIVVRAYVEDADTVAVDVENQGSCIDPDLLPQLFEPFRGGRSAPQARSSHLGLGLFVASELVRSHGGTLEVQSADDTTTFTVRLPRVTEAPPS